MSDKAYYLKFLCSECSDFETNSLTVAMSHVLDTVAVREMQIQAGSDPVQSVHDVYAAIDAEVEGM